MQAQWTGPIISLVPRPVTATRALGAFHVAVEVYSFEWSFGFTDEVTHTARGLP